jgi:FkbM family methyltransferase
MDSLKHVVVDVGAARGDFSNHILTSTTKFKVIAIEPNILVHEANLLKLRSKFEDRFIFQAYALDEEDSKLPLYGSKILNGQVGSLNTFNLEKKWSNYLSNMVDNCDDYDLVEVKSVKNFLTQNRIDHISFLKVDTQVSDVKLINLFLELAIVDCMVVEVNATEIKSENIYNTNNTFKELFNIVSKYSLKIFCSVFLSHVSVILNFSLMVIFFRFIKLWSFIFFFFLYFANS